MWAYPAVFCDTSFFYAALDRRDREHDAAQRLFSVIHKEQTPLLTSWEVITETVTLLRYRHSYQGAVTFIKEVLPRVNIIYSNNHDRAKALQIFLKFGKEIPLSLCDAMSYVLISERLEWIPCLAFDEDFKRLGLTVYDDVRQ